ncbi:Glycosyl hydrolase superfamily protein [Zea mays]|uniref:Chitinase domain-containing protein 1 n=1 Tax=Zea mays TaxID=4577 RepID=A0A1D6MEM1_MAIZE|nr:Glycosyl hydrolase superfamily protein [Zea mays]
MVFADASWASDGERHPRCCRRQLRHEQSDTMAVEEGGQLAACKQWWCPGSICLYAKNFKPAQNATDRSDEVNEALFIEIAMEMFTALEFVKQLGEALHSVNSKSSSHHLELIYVILAPRMQKLNNQDFGPKDLMHLADTVDGVFLMTYDFSGPQNPGPSAPLKWIHHSLAALLSAKGSSHSNSHSRMIFLGINFYGNDFLLSGEILIQPSNSVNHKWLLINGVLSFFQVLLPNCVFLVRGNHESFNMMGLCSNKEQDIGLLWGPDITQQFMRANHLKVHFVSFITLPIIFQIV